VTRPRAQAAQLTRLLEAYGAETVALPTIRIEPPENWAPLDGAIRSLDGFRCLIFTSVNGVAMVDRRLSARGLAWATITRKRVAAIGPATAEALAEHGVRVELVPPEYRAEALVEALRRLVGPADRVLLPRAKETRDVLVVELRRLGVTVTEVPAYQTRRIEDGVVRLREALASGSVDAVTFTSSSTARNFAEQFSDSERSAWRGRIAVASIGPITAATAAEYGLSTDVMPSEYTIPALARALADYFARAPRSAGRRSRRSE